MDWKTESSGEGRKGRKANCCNFICIKTPTKHTLSLEQLSVNTLNAMQTHGKQDCYSLVYPSNFLSLGTHFPLLLMGILFMY